MRLHSIRWRLPISYAAIALLAAVALGTVLLATLRGYYVQRERSYLTGNAEAIGAALTPLVEAGVPSEVLQSQLDNFAFLSQVRVQLLDTDGQTVVTSTAPGAFDVSVVAVPVASGSGRPWDGADQEVIGYWSFIAIRQEEEAGANPWQPFDRRQSVGDQELIFLQPLPVAGTLYGFDLAAETEAGAQRSSQVVRRPLADTAGRLLGFVQLSDGPAYGRQVVERVAVTWAIASLVAVVLAAAAGWLFSRRMSKPIVALAGTTARMAAGDLAARADAGSRPLQELALLSSSFNHMAGQVETTIVALRRFVSDAAHELHTPLTALRTNLELAADGDEAGRQVFLERAQAQVDRLEKLASGLLDLSRLEAGPLPERALVDVTALLGQTGEMYASQAEQAGLTLSLVLPPGGEPLRVQADEAQVRRAVDNLVDNAYKFTAEGGQVTIGARAADDGGHWAELWVEDTGIGIPAADMPQLFDRFHRGRNAAAYPGNGLGLAIVKAIADSHGGQVIAEPTGHGTRFRLRLPRDEADR